MTLNMGNGFKRHPVPRKILTCLALSAGVSFGAISLISSSSAYAAISSSGVSLDGYQISGSPFYTFNDPPQQVSTIGNTIILSKNGTETRYAPSGTDILYDQEYAPYQFTLPTGISPQQIQSAILEVTASLDDHDSESPSLYTGNIYVNSQQVSSGNWSFSHGTPFGGPFSNFSTASFNVTSAIENSDLILLKNTSTSSWLWGGQYDYTDWVGIENIKLVLTVDQTPPSTQARVMSNQGKDGWYVGPVQLALNASDNQAGVAATYYSTDGGTTWQTYTAPVTFSKDGKYSIEYYSVDGSGNQETPQTVSFNIDQTAPTTHSNVTGKQGKDNWYVGSTQLHLFASDNLSGVAATYYSTDGGNTWQTYTSPVSFPTDGKYNVEYYSVDNAGNKESAQSVGINIDQTAPSIKITAPTNGSYLDDQSLTVAYSVSDSLSGVDNSTVGATLDGQSIPNGTTIPLYTLGLGLHTYTVNASDNAGNPGAQTVTFQVGTSLDSLKQLVSLFTINGSIDNGGISNALTEKLDSGNLQAFINQVQAQDGKQISGTVATYLLRDANFLMRQ